MRTRPTESGAKRLQVKSLVVAGPPGTVGTTLTHSYSLAKANNAFVERFKAIVAPTPGLRMESVAIGSAYEVDVTHTGGGSKDGAGIYTAITNEREVTGLVGSVPPSIEQILKTALRVCMEPTCADFSVDTNARPVYADDGSFHVPVRLRLQRKDIIR